MVSPNGPITLEPKLQNLMDCAPLGIVLLNAEKRAVSVNRFWCNLAGQPEGTLDWKSALEPKDREYILDALEQLAAHSPTFCVELPLAPPAGTGCRVEFNIVPEVNVSGALQGWLITALDITAAHEARIARETDSRRYRLLTETSNDMIVRISLAGVRLYVSPASIRILGYAPEELLGATPIAAIHPDDRARVARTCGSLLEGVQSPVCSYRQLHRDGHYVWLEANYRLVQSDIDGSPSEFVATVRDISVRQDAEMTAVTQYAQLEESKRQLELSEATAHLGHWSFDLGTGAVRWSDEVFRIHGLAPASNAPDFETVLSFYHPEDEPAVRAMIERAASQGVPYSFRARLIRVDGSCIHVAAEGRVELAPNGEAVGLFGVFQDITKQVEIEQALAAARDLAHAAVEAQSLLLATMSHEIRTPVTGIVGLVEMLSDTLSPDDRARTVANLRASATSLIDVLDDVLNHAELENSRVRLEDRTFDLTLVVEQTIDLFRPVALAKGLKLDVAAPALAARGDPVRLRRIIANFISNAIKFTPTGRIDVTVKLTKTGLVRVEVVDQGIGIEADVLARLFTPFTQADTSIRRTYGGSGLGLSITRQLAELMGGRVGANSLPGRGSRFWTELPLHARAGTLERPATAALDDAEPLRIDGRAPRVLVVDDTATTRLVCEAHLAMLGCETAQAEDGIVALRMIAAEPYDAVLLDSAMPVLDGATIARCIRLMPDRRHVTVVGFTAHALPEHQQPLLTAGIDALLIKPFLRDNLRQTLAATWAAPRRANIGAPAIALPNAAERARALATSREPAELLAHAQRIACESDDAVLELLTESAAAVLACRPASDADTLFDLIAHRLTHHTGIAA